MEGFGNKVTTFALLAMGAAFVAGLTYRYTGTVQVVKALTRPFELGIKGASGAYIGTAK